MTNLPSVCIITAAARVNANLVWAAMGRGPETFMRRLTDATPALPVSPVTHYIMADSSSSAEDVAVWQAMQGGDLPPIPEGSVWGQDGIISAADAMLAVSAANLQVYSASGNVVPAEHVAGVLTSRGLRFVPDEV